jgi:iron-sulfur cluster repair protein YtfE (RIC family)
VSEKPRSKSKKAVKKKKKSGGQTKFKKEYSEQAFKLCLLGATDAELADFFEVKESTINEWKKKHKDFSESIKSGKVKADANVASSLYKRATGYQHTETTSEMQYNRETGESQFVVSKVVTKEVSPDTGACMAWLKNRQKTKWRDKQDLEISGNVVLFQGDDELED